MPDKNFIVKNGIEVDGNLIYANPDTNKVGIKTSTPTVELDVNGGIRANNLNISDTLFLYGDISINGVLGEEGYYITKTGTGITWSPVPGLRTIESIVASPGQNLINANYNPSTGVDVFVDGVRLTASDYTADNGTNIVLEISLFGGEKVDVIAYSVFGTGSPGISFENNSSQVGLSNAINTLNFVGFGSISISGGGNKITVENTPENYYNLGIKNQIRFYENETNCPNYVSFQAPEILNSTTSYTLPGSFPVGNDYALTCNTVGILTWKAVGIGSTSNNSSSGIVSCGVGISTSAPFKVTLGPKNVNSSFKVLIEAVDVVNNDIEFYEGFIVNTIGITTIPVSKFLTGFNVQAPTDQNFLTISSTIYDGSNNLVLNIQNIASTNNNLNVKVQVNPMVCS